MRAACTSVSVAGVAVFAAALPAFAHHSFASVFDANKPLKLTGVVTKVEWQNPHAWFYVDVKDEAGKVTNWGWEMANVNMLMRAGWTRTSLKVGDPVTVDGFQARDGSNIANAKVVILASTGRRLFSGSPEP